MSDKKYRLDTEDQRERLRAARHHGEICAACGRVFETSEPVYIERFGTSPTGSRPASAWAPVGTECVSSQLLERTLHQASKSCAGRGRDVYYGTTRENRFRALCSERCTNRANRAQARRRQAES
jgi:hypothetical protein